MIKNYLTIAYRHFLRENLYSIINVVGLATGITCSILIYLYVADELSFDRFHSKSDRIYRINEFFDSEDGSSEHSSSVPFPMGENLRNDYPNLVEEYVRFFDFQAPTLTLAYEPTEKEFNERNVFFVDSTYHRVFDLVLEKGDSKTALDNPNAVLITEEMARKYFGEEDAMHKLLRFQGQTDLMVTGIMKEMPANAHFRADFLISFSTLRETFDGSIPNGWYWNPCWTYILMPEHASPDQLRSYLPSFVQKHLPDFIKNDVELKLQRLTDIHLTSHLEFEIEPNSSEANIYLFSGIAVFVLIIACINFMNLATARSANRAREVGMRKALGSQKHQLVLQFMVESLLMSYLAVTAAVALVYLSLGWFNQFADKELSVRLLDPAMIGLLLGTGTLVGLVSGIYPALVLTSFPPIKALKAKPQQNSGLSFRKILVTAQFAISIVLIISTGVALKQLEFLQRDDTGFTREHIIMIPVIRTPIATHYETFREEVLQHSGIRSVTVVEEILGAKHQGGNYQFEGMEASNLFSRLNVRHDFLKTFDIPLLAGRDFDRDILTDDSLALVVNETLVRSFGWTPEEALTKTFTFGPYQGKIVGVTKDFHFASKHEPIGPLVLTLNTRPSAFNLFLKYMAVNAEPSNIRSSLDVLEQKWKQFIPGRPFEYFFLDSELNALYKAETNLGKVATTFSVLAIVVACLGLFGLASYSAQQRRKEIGIRKVMGSSTRQIVTLMFSDYSRLLAAAILIACPLAYVALDRWLMTFAFRIEIPAIVFVAGSLITVAIALLTVSYTSISVARTNPVDSLKCE